MAKAKEIEGLDCGASAAEGVARVLATRLDELLSFRDAALDFSTDKGVHDMRVASRRLRSALRDFTPYLSKKRMAEAKDELRRVARTLGAVRDEDVAIALIERLAAEAPEDVRAAVETFAVKRRARRETARRELSEEFSGGSLARLREDFTRSLAQATRPREAEDEAASAALKFSEAGREVVVARWAEMDELSDSLYSPLDAERLHSMRIAAKRLRYATELLAPCFGGDALKPFSEEVADMQTALGELHDCDEWIAAIGGWLKKDSERDRDEGGERDAGETRDAHAQRRAAAFWMLDHFTRLRNEHYRQALRRWREWERTDFIARLRAAIGAT